MCSPLPWRAVLGDVTRLVCFGAFRQATCELEKAQLRYRVAAHNLAAVRETLSQVLDTAYQQQSFGPLNTLFDQEEAALTVYERAVDNLAQAEERWCALRVAMAYERAGSENLNRGISGVSA
jgi:hypothetical protein